MKYCNSLTKYSRLKTKEVKVGNIGIGGSNPIRIQSMTTTNTMDTEATVNESIRMINAGCELVRITAPSRKEAENLQNIKNELLKRGYNTPLVADIHYTPKAAEIAAKKAAEAAEAARRKVQDKLAENFDGIKSTAEEEAEKAEEAEEAAEGCELPGSGGRKGAAASAGSRS